MVDPVANSNAAFSRFFAILSVTCVLRFALLGIGPIGVSQAIADEITSSSDKPTRSAATFLRNVAGRKKSGSRRGELFPVGRETTRIQIAFVIDNSNLSKEDLDGLKTLLPEFPEDSIDSHEVWRTVAYRKNGKFFVEDFTTSAEVIRNRLNDLTVDRQLGPGVASEGLWGAVEEPVMSLNWDVEREDTLRWVIVCGSSSSQLPVQDKASLAEGVSELASKARSKNVSIVSLVYGAPHQNEMDAEQEISRRVFSDLSRDTDGTIVDLESQHSRNYWFGKSTDPLSIDSQMLGEDSLAIRINAPERATAARFVMENVLRRLPCAVVGSQDNARYTVDVSQSTFRGKVEMVASLRFDGEEIASEKVGVNSRDVVEIQAAADRCMRALLIQTARNTESAAPHAVLHSRILDHLERTRELRAMVANHPKARDEIVAAIELLQSSHLKDATEMKRSVDRAIAHLNNADYYDQDNAFALLLMANCQRDLAQASEEMGRQADQQRHMRRYERFVDNAYDASLSLPDSSAIRLAIQAEWHLSYQRFQAAIDCFEKLATHELRATADLELRAKWMLAGLYAGDWGVANAVDSKQLIRPDLARSNIEDLIAEWPSSPQATFLRDKIRESVGNETEFRFPLGEKKFATWLTSALDH